MATNGNGPGRPKGNGRYTCEQMIEALAKTKGMPYKAAELLGCSHMTVYNYINKHPSVREALDHARGMQGDETELKLFEAIERGEPWAITFYLATVHKDRGYTKRQEIEHDGDIGFTVVMDK